MVSGDLTASTLAYLEGSRSGARYAADELRGMDPADGRTLLARYDLAAARDRVRPEAVARSRVGLWRWEALLPVRRRSFITTLGEGATPLLPPGRVARQLGLSGLHIKAESVNPTGSFKARGMGVAVSRAAELGALHLVTPSAGDAGGALAAYAAAARLRAPGALPPHPPPPAQAQAPAHRPPLILLDV